MIDNIKTGKAFWHGYDKGNRPCLILRMKHHWAGFTQQQLVQFLIYLVEQGIRLADENGSGQVVIIFDKNECTTENKDKVLFHTIKRVAKIMQAYYAERLHAIYFLNLPWFMRLFLKTVMPLINYKTRNKMHVLGRVRDIKKFFNDDQLLVEYGGTDTYEHPYPVNK